MSAYFSLVHNRKYAKNKNGKYSVNIRVTIDRVRHYLSITGFPKIEKQHWDKKREELKNTHPEAWQLNDILSDKMAKIKNYHFNCIKEGFDFTIEGLKAFINAENSSIDFIAFSRTHVFKRRDIVKETKATYNAVLKHLEAMQPDLQLKHITRQTVERFADYLTQNEGVSANYVNKLVSRFGTLYRNACNHVDLSPDNELFKKLGVSREPAIRFPLSEAELNAWEAIRMHNLEWEYLRNLFTFQCHTGLYYSDVRLLELKHIKEHGDKKYLIFRRFKNNLPYIIPMDATALSIIDKYGNAEGKLFTQMVHEVHFNKKIQMIGKEVGIKHHITNRSARHTFADIKAAKGVPRAYLSKMLGHTKEETAGVYYDLSDDIFFANVSAFI